MFDIGFLELLVVGVVGLLVLGPERLPVVVRQVAAWLAKSRHFANQLKDEFEREANLGEMRAALEKQKKEFETQVKDFERDLQEQSPNELKSGQKKALHEENNSGLINDD